MTRFFVYPYKQGSASAKALAVALDGKVIKLERSRYRNRLGHVVINWGNSECPHILFSEGGLLNLRSYVCGNKLDFFRQTNIDSGPRCIPWTTNLIEADVWLTTGSKVVARKVLTGHSGDGIVIYDPGQMIDDAPLYTKYIKKKAEYRIHVMKTRQGSYEVFDWQRKVKDPDREVLDWQVRNHQNGFIFIRETESPSEDAKTQAIRAVAACGLDFGAVDVLIGSADNLAYVLEVNGAPGLSGVTVDHYRDAFVRNFG